MLRQRFGAHLRRLRKAHGLTQEALAHHAGIDAKYLGAVERGQENISLDRIEQLASVLDVDPAEMLQPEAPSPDAALDAFVRRMAVLYRRANADKRRLMLQLVEDVSVHYGKKNPPRRGT